MPFIKNAFIQSEVGSWKSEVGSWKKRNKTMMPFIAFIQSEV